MSADEGSFVGSGGIRGRFIVLASIGLALVLAYFWNATPDPAFPEIRARETRLAFLLHFACDLAFVIALFQRLRSRHRSGVRLAGIVLLGFLAWATLSAAASPIRGAAIERLWHWVDAALVFLAAAWTFRGRPEPFLLLIAGVGGLLFIADLLSAVFGGTLSPDWPLALGGAALAAYPIYLGLRRYKAGGNPTVEALTLSGLAAMVVLVEWALSRSDAGSASQYAARLIAEPHPFVGAGLGVLPEILPAFAPADYSSLPPPQSHFLAARVEMGWTGVLIPGLLALVALMRGVSGSRSSPSASSPLFRLGAVALLVFLAADFVHRATLLRPYGQILFFALAGLLSSRWRDDENDGARAAGSRRMSLGPRLIFGAACVSVLWLLFWESRPWRAARMAVSTKAYPVGSVEHGQRIRSAIALYPFEAGHWEALASNLRKTLSGQAFNEELFQSIVEAYQKAIQLNPYRFRIHYGLGDVLNRAERPKEAAAAYARGLSYLPHSESLRRWLVTMLRENGDLPRAAEELRLLERQIPPARPPEPGKPPARNPEWIEVNFILADVLEKSGDLEGALAQSAVALQKDPWGPTRARALGKMEELKAKIRSRQGE